MNYVYMHGADLPLTSCNSHVLFFADRSAEAFGIKEIFCSGKWFYIIRSYFIHYAFLLLLISNWISVGNYDYNFYVCYNIIYIIILFTRVLMYLLAANYR